MNPGPGSPDSHRPPGSGPTIAPGLARVFQGATADLASVRHELRTPINHIIGYCEMIQEEGELPASFRQDLFRIHEGGKQLLVLISDCFAENQHARRNADPHELGHKLRTPVNHIIGYSEMLEELATDQGLAHLVPDLRRIQSAARTWLELMERQVFPNDGATHRIPAPPTTAPNWEPPEIRARPAVAEPTLTSSILVVDDDLANREMLARRLRRDGHRVETAENGEAALCKMRSEAFDAVLLDLLMPVLDGQQTLARMKAEEALRHIPVLMISAMDEEARIARCLEMGAEDYLSKPFNPVFLRARLGACLEKKRLRDREVAYLKQIEVEKKRADHLLHVLLPDEVAEELRRTNAVKPRRFENAAILFADVVGFTTWCDQHPPEEIVDNLQALFVDFEALLRQHGLEKIQTVGDCFMAAGGILTPLSDPALSCVRCGLEMVAATRRHPAQWRVHIGVHLGPVVTGVLGLNRFRFDLMGDTVNTTARVQALSPADAVCVSAPTWQRIAGACQGQSLGVRLMKGKGEMEVFQVHRVLAK